MPEDQAAPGDGDRKGTDVKDGDTRPPSSPTLRSNPLLRLPVQEHAHPRKDCAQQDQFGS